MLAGGKRAIENPRGRNPIDLADFVGQLGEILFRTGSYVTSNDRANSQGEVHCVMGIVEVENYLAWSWLLFLERFFDVEYGDICFFQLHRRRLLYDSWN